jgi:hypothetical protein
MLTRGASGGRATSADPVVVCGAGAAGMAAALSAARCGASVLLLEAGPQPGGTVANALIHTLGGLFDSAGELINDGLPLELTHRLMQADSTVQHRRMGRTWVLNVCPNLYRSIVQEWIESEPDITPLYRTRLSQVERTGDRVEKVEACGPHGRLQMRVRAIVDATGAADAVRLVDPQLVHDDARAAAGGWIFRLRGVAPGALAFPKGAAVLRSLHQASREGHLPPECGKAWIDSGLDEDEVFVKLFVPLRDAWRTREVRAQIARRAAATQQAVVDFLRRLPGFARARVSQTGGLGVRDGGRIRGEYTLTRSDVQRGRRFSDAACRGCWPIEYWDPENGLSLEYLPPGSFYEIPLRSLRLSGLENVWAAGKCLSADRHAQASARVVGTCWAMGEAAGAAAAADLTSSSRRPTCSHTHES